MSNLQRRRGSLTEGALFRWPASAAVPHRWKDPEFTLPASDIRARSSGGRLAFWKQEPALYRPRLLGRPSCHELRSVYGIPSPLIQSTDSAFFPYRVPWQAGQAFSTSGRNCTSRLVVPVPSHSGHLRLPVLYEKGPALKPCSLAYAVSAKTLHNSSWTLE